MISFEKFDNYMTKLQNCAAHMDKSIKSNSLDSNAMTSYGLIISLLEDLMLDRNKYIQFYANKLAFGRKALENPLTDSCGRTYALRSNRELYNLLMDAAFDTLKVANFKSRKD